MNAKCSDLSIDDVMDRVADTRKPHERCLGVPFQRVWPRAARPWTGLTPPSTKGADCRAPLPW